MVVTMMSCRTGAVRYSSRDANAATEQPQPQSTATESQDEDESADYTESEEWKAIDQELSRQSEETQRDREVCDEAYERVGDSIDKESRSDLVFFQDGTPLDAECLAAKEAMHDANDALEKAIVELERLRRDADQKEAQYSFLLEEERRQRACELSQKDLSGDSLRQNVTNCEEQRIAAQAAMYEAKNKLERATQEHDRLHDDEREKWSEYLDARLQSGREWK